MSFQNKTVIITGASRGIGKAIGSDWRSHFVAIGDASTAPQKKPHPQVYLQMLDAMQLPASHCLAFEDSPTGVLAAKAAKMKCVAVPDEKMTGSPIFGIADLVISSLEDFKAEHIHDL